MTNQRSMLLILGLCIMMVVILNLSYVPSIISTMDDGGGTTATSTATNFFSIDDPDGNKNKKGAGSKNQFTMEKMKEWTNKLNDQRSKIKNDQQQEQHDDNQK